MRRSIPAVLLTVAAAIGLAPAALAHGDEGKMTVTVAEQAGPGAIRLEVGILYANDEELAEEATVSATLTGPAGEKVGPVDLPRISGARYGTEVSVPVPGAWAVTVGSTTPTAQGTATVTVAEQAATTTSSTTEAAVPTVADEAPATPSDDGGSGAGVAIAVVAVVVLAAAVGYVLRRRRSRG